MSIYFRRVEGGLAAKTAEPTPKPKRSLRAALKAIVARRGGSSKGLQDRVSPLAPPSPAGISPSTSTPSVARTPPPRIHLEIPHETPEGRIEQCLRLVTELRALGEEGHPASMASLAGQMIYLLSTSCADEEKVNLQHLFKDVADGNIHTFCDQIAQNAARIIRSGTRPASVAEEPMDIETRHKIVGDRTTGLARRYPPSGIRDPMRVEFEGDRMVMITDVYLCFQDDEIKEIHAHEREENRDGIVVHYSKNGQAIIQQQALEGCTAGAAAMLIADRQIMIHTGRLLRERTASDGKVVIPRDIEAARLTPITSSYSGIEHLASAIRTHGSAIIGINDTLGTRAHVIIVDAIHFDDQTAVIRDPYHGWQITVTLDALRSRVESDHAETFFIQIEEPAALL